MVKRYLSIGNFESKKVADNITELFSGEYGMSTDLVRAKKVDLVSFQISYIPIGTTLNNTKSPNLKTIEGIDNLETIIREIISSKKSNKIEIERTELGKFSLYLQ